MYFSLFDMQFMIMHKQAFCTLHTAQDGLCYLSPQEVHSGVSAQREAALDTALITSYLPGLFAFLLAEPCYQLATVSRQTSRFAPSSLTAIRALLNNMHQP